MNLSTSNHNNASSSSSQAIESFDAAPATPNRPLPAWLFSFGLHTILFLVLFLALANFRNGAGDVETRTGGIVLVDATAETTEYLSEGENADSSSRAAADQSPPPLPSGDELPPDLPGAASSPAEITGIGDTLMDALPGSDSMLEGFENAELGGKVTTEIFGVKGTGSRFIYVFDRSESMEGYERRPLLAAKSALKASLTSLQRNHQFQIVFYNDRTRVLKIGGQSKMFFGTDENKEDGMQFIDSISGNGGTDHLGALKYALSLGPDVVFLLTDAEGGFSEAEMGAIADWNRSGAVINSIEFGVGSKGALADDSLERLSRQHRGQYVYKNILTLRLESP